MRTVLRLITVVAMLVASQTVGAQGTNIYNDVHFDPVQRSLYFVGYDRPHTTLRNYSLDEVRRFRDIDSLVYANIKRTVNTRLWLVNDFFNNDFLNFSSKDSAVYVGINLMCDFSLGRDVYQKGEKKTWLNSRGANVYGHLGKNFWFYADLTENQADFANYYNHLIDSLGQIPGIAGYKKETDYDYESAEGYVAFRVGPYVDFQVGCTKTFIGDGYRSLLLGDGAIAVPTYKMNVTFLCAKYMMMMTQLRDTKTFATNNGTRVKYSFTHFLDWNIGRRFTIGLFENVTQAAWWKNDGSYRGIDLSYLLPFTVFRAAEYNAGSPDKMLVGMTSKFVCTDMITVYGQIMLNEFRFKELVAGNGYWSNKYGFQIGLKSADLFKVPGLDFQFEYNQIRPFCYSQFDAMGCYTNKGHCMAHPLGANLKEGIAILKYRYGRLHLRAQANVTAYGDDYKSKTDTVSYGHNPHKASTNRNASYGVHTLQGLRTDLRYLEGAASFFINPKNMMALTLGLRRRTRDSELVSEESKSIYFSLRWNMKSQYYDY